jgi:hypothetical protein
MAAERALRAKQWTRLTGVFMKGIRSWIAAALGCVLAATATAQTTSNSEPPAVSGAEYPRGKISGLVFGDAYYNIGGDPGHGYNASGADSARTNIDGGSFANGQPRVIGRDLNGLQIRRIYFQLDNELSSRVLTRFRLEADSKEVTSGGKIGVFVKAAYVQVKDVVPRGNVLVGMTNTPTFENSEEFWGYRSVEKTIVDFRGLASSSDLGVNLKGYVDDGHRIGYSAMVGDGTGQKPEDNRYKRAYLALPLRPVERLRIEPYVDYEGAPGDADRALYKLFVGYELRRAALGAEIVDRVNHVAGGRNKEPFGISVFGRAKASDRLGAFARYDRWQPDTRAADRVDSDLYIAGLDWEPVHDLHFMPNVEATGYRARGAAVSPPHHDMQARVTFYYRFSKP